MLALSFAALTLGKPAEPDFPALYRKLEAATLANNAKSMKAWYAQNTASNYQYRSRDGVTFNRRTFIKGIDEQAAAVQRVVSFKMVIKGPTKVGTALQIEVKTDFAGITTFDGVKMRLTDKSTVSDTWQNVKGAWKLVKSRQTAADTQMQPGN